MAMMATGSAGPSEHCIRQYSKGRAIIKERGCMFTLLLVRFCVLGKNSPGETTLIRTASKLYRIGTKP